MVLEELHVTKVKKNEREARCFLIISRIPGDKGEGMGVKEGHFASIWFLLLLSDMHTSVYSLIVCYSFIRIFSLSLSLSRSHIALFLVHSHTRENATV